MLACGVGDPDTVKSGITALVDRTGADELMVVSEMHDFAARLRSFEIIAEVLPRPPRPLNRRVPLRIAIAKELGTPDLIPFVGELQTDVP